MTVVMNDQDPCFTLYNVNTSGSSLLTKKKSEGKCTGKLKQPRKAY